MRWSHNGLIIARIKRSDYREVYAGLLWWQLQQGYWPGWLENKFFEIFGKFPKPRTWVLPQEPSADLREYLGIMNTRYRAKKKREEALKKDDLLPSFMTEEDWQVKL